jgi:D-alanine-D-alanine ligase
VKIAVLHNLIPAGASKGDDTFAEYDSAQTIARVANALRRLDVEVEPVLAHRRLPWQLDEGRYDFVFNLAEGAGRRCREAIPAAICELLGIPFSGSDALTLAITLDKAIARRVVSPEVPVARAVLVQGSEDEAALSELRYPVLAKPNDEGSSKGIDENSLARHMSEAVGRCRSLRARYDCPVLVEEFLSGIEITVGIIGNGTGAYVVGMMEIEPIANEKPFVYSLEVKRDWARRVRYHLPARLDATRLKSIEHLALTAYRLLGCRDFARIDFRLDAAGQPRFLECNPLPGLDPENSDFVILSRSRCSYETLVQTVFKEAAERLRICVS